MSLSRPIACSLVLLLSLPAYATTVNEPKMGTAFFDDATSANERARDVYRLGDSFEIDVAGLPAAEACTLTSPSSAITTYDSSHADCSSGDGGVTYDCTDTVSTGAPGDLGEWSFACPGVATVTLYVAEADAHQQMWMPDDPAISGWYGDPSIVWDQFDDIAQGPGFMGICDATIYPAVPQNNFGVDSRWPRDCAWRYLLHQALPELTYKAPSGGTEYPIVKWDLVTATRPATGNDPSDLAMPDDYLAFANAIERLTLAYVLAAQDTSDHTDPANLGYYADMGTPLPAIDGEYELAVRYWVEYLVDTVDWSAFDDLKHSRMLIALSFAYDAMFPDLTVDERRKWRDAIAIRANELEAIIDANPPLLEADLAHKQRMMRNGHHWATHAAVGVAAYALQDELLHTSSLDQWQNELAEPFYTALLAELGEDGSNGQGLYYDEHSLDYMVRFLEASRISSSSATGAYAEPWIANVPLFYQYMTLPNGQRAVFADGHSEDNDKPSEIFSRLAAVASPTGASVVQRQAWLGHNDWTYDQNRRDVLDALWWDDSLTPLGDTALDTLHDNRCFPDTGLVSLRASPEGGDSGWEDADAAHLVAHMGRHFGGHGDPAVGSFSLFAYGSHLVTDDFHNGGEEGVKRTALHSTLLYGRDTPSGTELWGQHGDGVDHTDAVPDAVSGNPDENNAALVRYLDSSGTAFDGSNVDLVTVAVNMTQMYRYDDNNDPTTDDVVVGRASPSQGALLEEFAGIVRYLVWFGSEILVFDMIRTDHTTTNARIDWFLNTADMHTSSGVLTVPPTCGVATSGGLPLYEDAYSSTTTATVTFDGSGQAECDGDPLAPEKVWQCNHLEPRGASGCASTVTKPTVLSSSTADIDPLNTVAKLRVTVLDPGSAALQSHYTPWMDGDEIVGAHLRRRKYLKDGYLLTALQPTLDTATPENFTNISTTNSGRLVTVKRALSGPGVTSQRIAAMFTHPAFPFTKTSTSADELDGHMWAVVHKDGSPGDRFAANLAFGRKLKHANQTLIEVTSPSSRASVGVTYDNGSVWGTIDVPDGTSTSVWIYVQGSKTGVSGAVSVEKTTASGTTTTSGSIDGSGGITFTTADDLTFKIVNQGDPTMPAGAGSQCFGW